MDVFDLREKLVSDYKSYTSSFIKIRDERIKSFVDGSLDAGEFWPEPLLQLNPTFHSGGTIDDFVASNLLHPECGKIFRVEKSEQDGIGKQLLLHEHQRRAVLKASVEKKSFVLTSGTGSGKSLTYIIPIVDHVLRTGSGRGIKAIVVYPMNALANSQDEELAKFLKWGYPKDQEPARFARYTGQEKGDVREELRRNPPDILLTNYMMLELLLTRAEDRELVRAAQGLQFLVFDELHTYRGRQGADVALLIRRCRNAFAAENAICIGTSATMASGRTVEEQKREVAHVAQSLFGVPFTESEVIGEILERATPVVDISSSTVRAGIRDVLEAQAPPPDGFDAFRNHPLSSWIESTFGVRAEDGGTHLIRQAPRRLRGAPIENTVSAADELAELTGIDVERCALTLKTFLLHGSTLHRSASSRFPIFAFRLHQFLTRGDTVWATLEPEAERHLELSKKAAKPGDPDKRLFPLVFCRHCGTAYYRASMVTTDAGAVLFPREDRKEPGDDAGQDCYVYLSAEEPWPRHDQTALLQRLPEMLKETTSQGLERIRKESVLDVPSSIAVTPSGAMVAEGAGLEAALIEGNFLFCLNPSCGVTYAKNQRSERNKLATLGVDSRSTATTILAVRALIDLQADQDLKPEARKLLSFTDNRQDASLQAGHFNDFVQVALLRSALHRATESRAAGLSHGDLSAAVFEAMNLRFDDYAADPDVRGPAKTQTNDALRRVIDYYLYRDLQRGWRVTAPNLEDCGLLRFDYAGLNGDDGLLGEEEVWTRGFTVRRGNAEEIVIPTPAPLQGLSETVREEILRTLLDVMRRQLAVKVDVLDPARQQDLVNATSQRLLEDTVWYLQDPRDLTKSEIAYPRPRASSDRSGYFLSGRGGFGKFLKRAIAGPSGRMPTADLDEVIRFLMLALKRYGIVEEVRNAPNGNDPGYQLNAGALQWLAGDGTVRKVDRTRVMDAGDIPPEANAYFVTCYKHFVELKLMLEAREHTAQVAAEDRKVREERFRTGELPLLFCSPTMELGVDISQLNLVNLRNVPPTPANYAQRSGRAGRGGQPAMVFTYCAGRSPHDQYFYRWPSRMVAGAVAAPRIDLQNHDLVRSHVHAVWMEVAKPDLGRTLNAVLDLGAEDERKFPLAVKEPLQNSLRDPVHRANAFTKAAKLLNGISEELKSAVWFHDNWLKEVLDQLELRFNDACERWRNLYRSAVRQRELHHKIILDHARPEAERNHSRRLRSQAEAQIKLLTEAEGVFEGDFYSYRYFAAEGFLPGYNFPRLPLSAYVPARRGRRGRDEFVSRPRFLAISEFGPRALLYHEGARYRVNKVNLDFGSQDIEATHEIVTDTLKRCPVCAYAHFERGVPLEVCDRCQSALAGAPSAKTAVQINNLVQLQNVTLRLAERITCDEEERQRFGYDLVTSYRFPEIGGQQDRRDAHVRVADSPALRLSYGDATDLYRINLGWSNRKSGDQPGFMLDLERGYWAKNQADADDHDDAQNQGRTQRVVPYVKDTKNALVLGFEPAPTGPEMAALQAAFKQAVQQHFQLEPRELAAEPVPSRFERREILFFESSEGGAGVLRQLAEDPAVLPALARRALEICHFDPDTLVDTAAERCGKACYECLLDYGNQLDHKDMDRNLIRDTLARLAKGTCLPAGGSGSRGERVAALLKRCDSKLEQRWLALVDSELLRIPDEAQYFIPQYHTQPDFYYDTSKTAIYVDGPPHDTADQMRDDTNITNALLELGYTVIRFHHKEDWLAIFDRHPDIFGERKR